MDSYEPGRGCRGLKSREKDAIVDFILDLFALIGFAAITWLAFFFIGVL